MGHENIFTLFRQPQSNQYILSSWLWVNAGNSQGHEPGSNLLKTGFKPEFTIDNAINEIEKKFRNNNSKVKKNSFTVKWMKYLKLNSQKSNG